MVLIFWKVFSIKPLRQTWPQFSMWITGNMPLENIYELRSYCNDEQWIIINHDFFTETNPNGGEFIVMPWECLTPFQRIILIRILKPDALIASVRAFIEQLMGEKFVSSGDINLKEMYEESTAKTPLIFILSSGKWKHVYAMRMVDSA